MTIVSAVVDYYHDQCLTFFCRMLQAVIDEYPIWAELYFLLRCGEPLAAVELAATAESILGNNLVVSCTTLMWVCFCRIYVCFFPSASTSSFFQLNFMLVLVLILVNHLHNQ